MRKIIVHKVRQPSGNSQFLVIDETLFGNPQVLGKVEVAISEVMGLYSSDNFKTNLKSKIYELVVEKLGEDVEYSIKLDL
jgi:hypothetical protein